MMTYKLGSFEYCVLRCLQNIVEEFPDQPLQDIKEHDLIHNIIDPVLRSFLSSSTCRLRWPEVNADVRKYRTTRTQRPDAMISEVKGVQYSKCVAYGEAKAANMDNHGKGVDLIRLAVFGKDCIDAYKLNHVITFQIAAVTFFVESLQPETTYTCIELAQIGFPRAISDVKTFIDDVSSYYTIYKAFRSIQQSLDEDYWQDNHRETLDTPQYTHAIDKTKSNGRLCFVHYGR
ncbi:hypothetical protein BDC45DRAFT_75862 [Circinella umbellata]|nr:hypothetical protein BDC45DRAFT_75862 [Circinella umbellata]